MTIARVPLGRAGLEVTRLAFGGAPIGGLFSPVADDHARAALDAAWDAGIRWFDTAPHYGAGLSERRIGRWLGAHPERRGQLVLSTKVGRVLVPQAAPRDGVDAYYGALPYDRVFDYSRDGVLRSVEQSLARLGADRVDTLLIHDPDDHWAQAAGAAYPALHELRAQGVIRAVGVGMNQSAMLARFVRETDLDYVLLAGRYTLLDQGGLDELLPRCARRGVAVLAGGVLNSGILAGPHDQATYDYAPASAPVLARARQLQQVCAGHGVPLVAAALRFPLGHPAVVAVAVGARSAAEVTENVRLLRQEVPPALWDDLRAAGLLHPDAPAPAATGVLDAVTAARTEGGGT